jgi:hypothetical protein
LHAAEQFFGQQSAEGAPNWAAHWGETLFAAFAGHCWLDLGKPAEARPLLVTAGQGANGQVQRMVFSSAQLARLALLEGDHEQAGSFALAAADAAATVTSKRSLQVIRDLRGDLQNLGRVQHVKTFQTRADDLFAE